MEPSRQCLEQMEEEQWPGLARNTGYSELVCPFQFSREAELMSSSHQDYFEPTLMPL
jgi:hypothetical protein